MSKEIGSDLLGAWNGNMIKKAQGEWPLGWERMRLCVRLR